MSGAVLAEGVGRPRDLTVASRPVHGGRDRREVLTGLGRGCEPGAPGRSTTAGARVRGAAAQPGGLGEGFPEGAGESSGGLGGRRPWL